MVKNKRHDIVKLSKFKTSICTFYDTPSGCPFGERCAFAHGKDELREESANDSLLNDCSSQHEETDSGAGSIVANKKMKGPTTSTPLTQLLTPDSNGKVDSKTVSESTLLTPQSSLIPIGAQPDKLNDTKYADGRGGGKRASSTAPGGAPSRRHREGGRKKPPLAHLDSSTVAAGAPLHNQGLPPINPGMVSCMMPYYGAGNAPVAMYIPYSSIQHPYFNINSHSYVNVAMDASSAMEPPNYAVPMIPAHLYPTQSVHDYHQEGHHLTSSASMPNARPWHPTADPAQLTTSAPSEDGYLDSIPNNVVARPNGAPPAPMFSEIDMMANTKDSFSLKTVPQEAAHPTAHVKAPGGGVIPSAPTLQSLMSSTTPPTIVHIPFNSAVMLEQCRTGDIPIASAPSSDPQRIDLVPPVGATDVNADGTAWAPVFSTPLPSSGGRGWGGFTVLPGSDGLDAKALQTFAAPQTSSEATSPVANFQDFLRTVSQDEDDCVDLNRFLAQWGQFVTTSDENGQEGGLPDSRPQTDEPGLGKDCTIIPPAIGPNHVPDVAVPAPPPPDIADSLKEPLQVTASRPMISALQPLVPLKEHDDVSFHTSTDVAQAPVGSKKATVPPPKRAGLVCSMFREKAIPSKESAKPEKGTRAVRRPVMTNCFASSCSTKGIASERTNSIFLYNVEKNTVYYITAPCCLDRIPSKNDISTVS